MGEFAVQMEVVFGPENGDGTVLEDGGIPDALEPNVLVARPSIQPLLIRERSGCAIRANGQQHRIRSKELTGRGGVVGGHGVKETLNGLERGLRDRLRANCDGERCNEQKGGY